MRIESEMALTPVVKAKVDELFLRWLSSKETQKLLCSDLAKVIEGRPVSPRQLSSSCALGGNRSISPPAPPSISPTPLRSPRSPRDSRNTSKRLLGVEHTPRSPRVEKQEPLKNSMRENELFLNDKKITAGCASNIPLFYFPNGKPHEPSDLDQTLMKVTRVFKVFDEGKVLKHQFAAVTKACGLPLYWKEPLFSASGGYKHGYVTFTMFSTMWKRLAQTCHDDASRFVQLLSSKHKTNYLVAEDFVSLMQDIVDTHPGLTFLNDAKEFHSRYIHTVIARIFYCVNSSWTGRITIPELRHSNFLQVLSFLEEEEDINEISDYFSYEHFYVIYCKFWELDTDHDLLIDEKDLSKHNNHALSSRIVKRLFSGCVTRGKTFTEGKMAYPEFVWFLLSEEDKKHPRSIEYWFRCMDTDGDGVLSMYELEYFYEEQVAKMEALGIETMTFVDCLCQMLDLVKPKVPGQITLCDLKNCKMASIFYNTFFNLDKYLEYEQRDPFASVKNSDDDDDATNEQSDWERFAQEEYELLVAEEGAAEQADGLYEDDFEADEDLTEDDILDLKGDNNELFGSDDIVKRDPPWTFVADVDDACEEEYF